jgi:hypothetical protein
VVGQARQEDVVQLGEVAVERPQIAALDEDVGRSATEDDGAEPVPFGLVEEAAVRRQLVGKLCQHRRDGWLDREHRCP